MSDVEWAAIIGAIVIALPGVIVGWRLTLVTQRKLLEGQRREELAREGRQAAGAAIECLLTLRRELHHTVGPSATA